MAIDEIAAAGFGRGAEAYHRGRPEYPADAVNCLTDALAIDARSKLLELGAGTGKFTAALLPTGASIIAVEPVAAMRAQLAPLTGTIQVIVGTAESIPLSDLSVDCVVAAQAFHWFRPAEAFPEIHRDLKPRGGLGLIWNVRDVSVPWVAKLEALIASQERSIPRYQSMEWRQSLDASGLFSPLQTAQFPHMQTMTEETLADRVASMSFIAVLPDSQRAAVLQAARGLFQAEAMRSGRSAIDFPYRTAVYWCRRIEQ